MLRSLTRISQELLNASDSLNKFLSEILPIPFVMNENLSVEPKREFVPFVPFTVPL